MNTKPHRHFAIALIAASLTAAAFAQTPSVDSAEASPPPPTTMSVGDSTHAGLDMNGRAFSTPDVPSFRSAFDRSEAVSAAAHATFETRESAAVSIQTQIDHGNTASESIRLAAAVLTGSAREAFLTAAANFKDAQSAVTERLGDLRSATSESFDAARQALIESISVYANAGVALETAASGSAR